MKMITLEQVKKDLRVTHNYDDELLQMLLNASVDEACQFMNRDSLPLEEDGSRCDPTVPAVGDSVYAGVFLLVRAKYGTEKAEAVTVLRQNAETLLMPYRIGLGV